MSYDTDVLIVGAGPAGLTTALTLAGHGVHSLLVERLPQPSTHPRATVISTRSMEYLRSWGLEQPVLAGGVEAEWLMWVCTTLAEVARGTGVEVGIPSRAQAAIVSPAAPACVPQDHLERVLLEHLRSLQPATVAVGTQLGALESGSDGVSATLRAASGGEWNVRARYLVAADGAYSTVRGLLGIEMRGIADVLSGTTALFRAPLWSRLGAHRYGLYWTELPGAEGLFLPAGRGDRWQFGFLLDHDAPGTPLPTRHEMSARIRIAAGAPDLPVEIESINSFSSSAQLAERFRDGRVFLVGDAAHRVSPRGGTGMNTAIHDGYDLGWKLAWVLKGWASPDLLDTYEDERRPVAEHNVARSADPAGTRRASEEELRVDLGGRIPHHWVRVTNGRVSTLDLLGPGLTLFTGPKGGAWRDAAEVVSTRPPVAVHALDEITARALGIFKEGALLVRPDGIPTVRSSGAAGAGALLAGTIADVGATAGPTLIDTEAA